MQAVIIDRYLVRSGNGIQLTITPLKLLLRQPHFNVENFRIIHFNTQIETNRALNDLLRGNITLQQLIPHPGV